MLFIHVTKHIHFDEQTPFPQSHVIDLKVYQLVLILQDTIGVKYFYYIREFNL